MAQSKPVHEIRLGKVKAAIWLNETEVGPRYGVTLARIYKTDDGWESSSTFGRDELLVVAKVADMAHTWIFQQGEGAESERSETETRNRSNSRRSKATAR